MEGQKEFMQIDQNDLYPYLLVNIGSGVSMIKVSHCYAFMSASCGDFLQYYLSINDVGIG